MPVVPKIKPEDDSDRLGLEEARSRAVTVPRRGERPAELQQEPSARFQPSRTSSWSGPKREQIQPAAQQAPCILKDLAEASPTLSGGSGPHRTGLSWLKHKKSSGQTNVKIGYSTPTSPQGGAEGGSPSQWKLCLEQEQAGNRAEFRTLIPGRSTTEEAALVH